MSNWCFALTFQFCRTNIDDCWLKRTHTHIIFYWFECLRGLEQRINTDIETMTTTVKKSMRRVWWAGKKEWNFIEKNRISNLVDPFLLLFFIPFSASEWYTFFLVTEKSERMSKRVERIESKKWKDVATQLTKSWVTNKEATAKGERRKTKYGGHVICVLCHCTIYTKSICKWAWQYVSTTNALNYPQCIWTCVFLCFSSLFGFCLWAVFKLFPLRLIYFLKSPSRFVAPILRLYVLHFLHHTMCFVCCGCHGT